MSKKNENNEPINWIHPESNEKYIWHESSEKDLPVIFLPLFQIERNLPNKTTYKTKKD